MGEAEESYASREESEVAWKVSAEEIRATGYNLDRKNPNKAEESIGDPDELLARYKALEAEVQATKDELKRLLGEVR